MPRRSSQSLALTLDEARGLMLAAQDLFDPPVPSPGIEDVARLIDRLGVVQIDTISVIARSQYLVLWSRLGPYDPKLLDALLYPRRAIFEYWSHAASIVPISDYRYYRPDMLRARDDHPYDGVRDWLSNGHDALRDTLAAVRERGPLASSDFEAAEGAVRASPWDWYGPKESRRALEVLWNAGELMIHSRRAGQKLYDVRERVLAEARQSNAALDGAIPSDDALPAPAEQVRHFARRTTRALGVVTPAWLWDYFRLRPRLKYLRMSKTGKIGNAPRSLVTAKRGKNGNAIHPSPPGGGGAPHWGLARGEVQSAAYPGVGSPAGSSAIATATARAGRPAPSALAYAVLDEQVREGLLLPATIAGVQGPAYIAAERLPDLERLRAGDLPACTTLLSPFDSLIWDRVRARALFDYEVSFEAYVLPEKRRYGYYCLAILHQGRLVGRVDAKADRQAKTLLARALYLEPGVTADDALLSGLAAALLDLARFLGLLAVRLGASDPPDLAPALLERLSG
jgi:uncharacterized protein YcaQ